ncbi:hypothetical protein [Marinifilum caeruleilacunae]|uniref:Uncharacterized protein n=1 Tax=Marinifilum caeruleilacunae TaxID=2499076 RepID=A0ABX1X1F7_9BACT|nr:hypothetical protein [Marinifilum caeruleilacunae]NOU62248.1 hypothetical protein [Marinifilum caeruleilacunae]
MRKYILLGLLLLLSLQHLIAQNYANYHLEIWEAEKQIINNKYKEALLTYERIFNTYEKHFFKDVNNAFFSAVYANDPIKAAEYAREMVAYGYQLKRFDSPVVQSIKETKEWQAFLKEYPKLRKKYLKTFDKKYLKELKEIHLKDQEAAKSGKVKQMHKTYYENARRLSNLFQEYGFAPIGVYVQKEISMISAPLRHYCFLVNQLRLSPQLYQEAPYRSMDVKSIPLLDQMKQAVLDGDFLPQHYASAIVYGDSSRKNEFGQIIVTVNFANKELFLDSHTSKEKWAEMNKRRRAIGLFPLQKGSTDILQNTWYKDYPFDPIIEVLKSSGKKKIDGDLIMDMAREELKIRNAYEKSQNKEGFILSDFQNISGVGYQDYEQFFE